MRQAHPTLWAAMLGLAVLLFPVGRAVAEGVSTPALKAAFLFNFVKFTEWPDGVSGAPMLFCVLGDDQVEASLEQTVKNSPSSGRDDKVKRVHADSPVQDCHLLYISSTAAKESVALLKALGTLPTLTVSDLPDFAKSAGILNFIVEDQKMRFVINTDAADRARLRISSKLLGLAKIVKDQPTGIRR
jgi:hypothetical protein